MGTVFSVAEVGPLLTLAYARPRMLTGRKPIREKSSPISAVTILQTGPMPADPHVADIRERKSKLWERRYLRYAITTGRCLLGTAHRKTETPLRSNL